MKINTDTIDKNQYNRPGKPLRLTNGKFFVTWHYPAAPGCSGKQIRDYLADGVIKEANVAISGGHQPVKKGCHFTIGPDGIYMLVPPNEMTWHCGVNLGAYTPWVQYMWPGQHAAYYTIGIECAHNQDNRFTGYGNMVDFGIKLCRDYGLNPWYHFVRHFDLTYKQCPIEFVKHPEAWRMFLHDVHKGVNK